MRTTRTTLFVILLALLSPRHLPASTLQWVITKGDNEGEIQNGVIHITQREERDVTAYATATAPLNLKTAKTWKVSFEVRFGQLRAQGSSVLLRAGGKRVGTVGADGWYKGMTTFLHDDHVHHSQPADSEWHRFEFAGDERFAAIRHNGKEVGRGSIPGAPDTILIGAFSTTPGRQTEIWVRNIRVGVTAPQRTDYRPPHEPEALNIPLLREYAGRLANRMPPRQGEVGRVNGLAVRQTLLGGRIVREYGVPLTIEAEIVPGSGKQSLIAYAEPDSVAAAARAIVYGRRKIAEMGYEVDWTKQDIFISLAENELPNGGPSAGVADGLAFLSAALRMEVDSSVAVTGAIGLQGQVNPVGGVAFKADFALSQPKIHTLLVPAGQASIDGLRILFSLRPELLVTKRLILVKNMEEVLRQTLIGYDEETWQRARTHFQNGLRAFSKRQNTAALSELEKAARLTPEDATIGVWQYLISRATSETAGK